MSRYQALTVEAVAPDTRDAILVTLAVPDELRSSFAYLPGQHLNLLTTIDGAEVRRSYSICAVPGDACRLRIAIKRAPNGRFSNWANDHLRPGMRLEVLPPAGRFHRALEPAPAAGEARHYLAIAAGSGITPMFSLVKAALTQQPGSRVSLWYGNRASSAIMLREELAELKDRFLDRFSLVHVMSREQQDIDLFNGRLTADKAAALLDRWCPLASVDRVWLCGPRDMNANLEALFRARGFPAAAIFAERFATAHPGPAPEAAASARPGFCQATAIVDGRRHAFPVEKGSETILDAGLRHGLDLRYSCRSGVCATCRAKLVEGQVDMDGSFALEDYEIARGFILTCQSYPVTDRVTVDFDQDA